MFIYSVNDNDFRSYKVVIKCQQKGISGYFDSERRIYGGRRDGDGDTPPVIYINLREKATAGVMEKNAARHNTNSSGWRGLIKRSAIVLSNPSHVFSVLLILFFFSSPGRRRWPLPTRTAIATTSTYTTLVRAGVRNPSFPFVLFNVCRLPSRPINGWLAERPAGVQMRVERRGWKGRNIK